MTALAQDRIIRSKWTGRSFSVKLAAAALVYGGGAVAAKTDGYSKPADSSTLGLRVLGMALSQGDNTDGDDGDLSIQVEEGVYYFKNDGTNPVTQADVGRPCFVKDDQTVQDENGDSAVIMGTVMRLDADGGIWVYVSPEGQALFSTSAPETKTSGALSVYADRSFLSVTDGVAFTLGDGRYLNQKKIIECSVVGGTPVGTLTVNDAYGTEPTTWVFNTVGQRIELVWTSTGWKLERIVQAGIETVANAATANRLNLVHKCAIADTVDFIQPDGVMPGERTIWNASANSGTPVGTVSGVFRTLAGAAGTDINFNAASDAAACEWDGAKWCPYFLNSATIS